MYHPLSLYVTCILLTLHQTLAACPSGYTSYTNGCYKKYSFSSGKTYTQAKTTCSNDRSDVFLAGIRSSADNDRYAGLFSSGSMWIGMHRDTNDHPVWKYGDGTEPRNQGCYRYTSSTSGFTFIFDLTTVTYASCVTKCQQSSSSYTWAAIRWQSNQFKCGCSDDTFSDPLYDAANKQSWEHGCDEDCTGYPEGMRVTCGGSGFMTALKIGTNQPWSDFAAGQPNNYDGNQACAALVTQHTPDKLGDEGCYKLFPYICHDINFVFHAQSTSANWYKARDLCREQYPGGDLAKIRNAADRDGLVSELNSANYWIGLQHSPWSNTQGDALQHSNWGHDKPFTKSNRCATMAISSKQWSDVSCDSQQDQFVCATYDTTTSTSTTTTTTTTTTTPPTTTTTTPPPTTTTTTTPGGTGTGGITGGSVGASTNNSSGLSTIEIIMIVLCLVLIIIIIIMIILVCYYKRKNNRKNRVGYDGRPVAPVPYSGSLGDEVYLPAHIDSSSSTGSQTDLIKKDRPRIYHPSEHPQSRASSRPDSRITIDNHKY